MKNVLIDTNIYSLAMKGDEKVVAELRKIDCIGFSAISIGELFSGFKGGRRESKNRQELDIFLDSPRVRVHTIDEETADFYAAIVNDLKMAGTPIPTNDVWIAASVFQHGYKIYSMDRHFQLIPGLLRFEASER
ncbi:Ribonuclease VapC [Desulfosarcina cetonica]|uniref:type II toxin-antitoxin system VapC family toxin n=1 Tax=Desulfosarcina cetonica TaxID=90730 RepID=UPI0006CF43CC|nr:type II toxin-antitoxin system VapC family toxin [Desulfosarcina cetonica]VTR65029.1 Ribonuclease VapC [Desulfosarcina cetonica]